MRRGLETARGRSMGADDHTDPEPTVDGDDLPIVAAANHGHEDWIH